MTINYKLARKHLEAFDFKKLFVEVLGWGHGGGRPATLTVDGAAYRLTPVAELGGMVVFQCEPQAGEGQPPMPARRKIERQVTQTAFEHILIFTDRAHTKATWHWVKREPGSSRPREHTYTRGQPGDSLLQKLAGIAFKMEDLDADGKIAIIKVTGPVAGAFDVEKITKKFYEDFKGQHADFLKFIRGIPVDDDRAWYVSVMLNRLMFIYFIQRKGFLDGDPDYLQHKLAASQGRGRDCFYRDFLLPLFFEGFAHEAQDRSPETNRLLGRIPYLNGGIFLPHDLERKYGAAIAIPDAVFERIFAFFDKYTWHLDERPLHADNEINPDVLGFIFEKYINQKQMGAYYTKEDITGYICRNTILPFLLDKLGEMRYSAIHPLPLRDVEPYIYEAVKQAEHLPTETEREYAARQGRLAGIRADFAAGVIAAVNDLITYNLDIEAFVQDWLAELGDPLTLRAFYFECLKKLTVLDPTVGSGAFLFAAMNILEPLYEVCLDRMAELSDPKYPDFGAELARVAKHPNRTYFIYKSIIVHNLYGVDIMEEAVEICKLRLFLKLVAQVDDAGRIEPLPDIDFNIRAGNTLVGYATKEEVAAAGSRSLFNLDLEQRIREATRGLDAFRDMQDQLDLPPAALAQAKAGVRAQLHNLEDVLDEALANEYSMDVGPFVASHQPFHWYVQFHGIMREGGFDVIVGNPPWREYAAVRKDYSLRGYRTEKCGNLYGICIERATALRFTAGYLSLIVQLPLVRSPRMETVRKILLDQSTALHVITFDDRPGKLFDGLEHCRATVFISQGGTASETSPLLTTKYQRWFTETRASLFQRLEFCRVHSSSDLGAQFPKYMNEVHEEVMSKVGRSSGLTIESLTNRSPTSHFIFYLEATGYWVKVTAGLPFYAKNGTVDAPAHGRYLYFKDADTTYAIVAVLYSSLFYTHFLTFGDCFHLNDSTVAGFPVSDTMLADKKLVDLGKRLMAELRTNAERKQITTRDGDTIAYDEFFAWKSKAIIDDIDRVLARHYGFTDEELDFIINYDIKYRMGKEAATDENE